jgi:hypothetical protein
MAVLANCARTLTWLCEQDVTTWTFAICVTRLELTVDKPACRFGGVEGLRGMCTPRVVVLDKMPWLMRTSIPPPLQYPVAAHGFAFVHALCRMFYGTNVSTRVNGLLALARLSIWPPRLGGKAKSA